MVNQAARAAVLKKYQILDSSPEQAFDDLVNLAAQVCATPIALINLIDGDRQWFKAKVGLEITQMPTSIGFCPECATSGKTLIIPDTLADQRYAQSPVVTSAPYIRFYCGVPLATDDGLILGTVCVADTQPRELTPAQIESLKGIARLVMRQLDLRIGIHELQQLQQEYEASQIALAATECTLSGFFNSAPMMMGIVEILENDILHLSDNQAAASFFGVTTEMMQKTLASDLGMTSATIDLWLQKYRKAIQTRQPQTFQYVHNTEMGQRYFQATVTAIGSCCYTTDRCAYIVEDITAHKLADIKLEWKEALLRSMTDVSPLAFYVVDNHTGKILYFNQRFCEIWKIPHLSADMQGGNLGHDQVMVDCAHLVADREVFAKCCQPLHKEDDYTVVEEEISFVDGRIVRQFSTQVRDRNQKYLGQLYIFEDITARKQQEQKIREQAALLDITSDAIILRDLSNRILLWNQSAEKIYGWSAKEVYGKNATDVLFRTPKAEIADIYNTVMETGSWQGELRTITKLGKEIIIESCWTLVRDEHLRPKSILTVDTDITQTKALEHQFLRAQRMESIGTLASGIAHDLNNVLSPILMATQVLQLKLKNIEQQPILEIIENNTKRGASLVKQVLSFARGMEGDRTLLDIKHIIQEIQQIAEQTFPKTIIIDTDITPELWNILGDQTQIHQVLINLCLNARDAMLDGGSLDITAENITIDENYVQMNFDAHPGSYIKITITDTGCGIPKELIDRIFEPFFTTKEFGKGTGLGLSTVLGIVKGHGGFINVSSQVAAGTKFQVYLPAMQIDLPTLNENPEIISGQGEWILVVDDEAAIREITYTSLKTNNYQVILANDGIEAIALYAQHREKISAVIVDMMMPNMDGASTIKTLRKMNPLLPIVVVSGLVTSSQVFNTIPESNITQFLAKPHTTSELLSKLNIVINKS